MPSGWPTGAELCEAGIAMFALDEAESRVAFHLTLSWWPGGLSCERGYRHLKIIPAECV